MKTRTLKGLYSSHTYRVWRITWPYKTERYIFAGPKAGAEKAAKRLSKDYPYKPSIRAIKV